MYVCICHSVTDKAIKKAVKQGHDSLEAIQQELKVGTCCGRCKHHAREVIDTTLNPETFDFNLMQGAFA
ncbi:(2Fe-2S)-binding protein [Thiothrix nivea]|uniref:Bacterioferritin-associated ferredoxin n=1 Tax=Thiothrix nivea (strain ATCC 35100 / DSM 5205 / JP2) TaxID=870187 RepID=A0A656HDW8_THINJ|nr:(2Fe-2S)-binding protein [Thiothrix nivea]EIJ33630.1 BFD domain protein (2Fe-2S)-binding domain protein [Thiothrix nivea DSM 5205]